MEQWKRNDPLLRVGDSEEDMIIMSNNEEEVEAHPLVDCPIRLLPWLSVLGLSLQVNKLFTRLLDTGRPESRGGKRSQRQRSWCLSRGHVLRGRGSTSISPKARGSTSRLSPFSQAHRNVLLLSWRVMRTVRKRTEMQEKVPLMAFSVSSQARVHLPFPSHHPRRSLPLRR